MEKHTEKIRLTKEKVRVNVLLNKFDYLQFRIIMRDLKMTISSFLNEVMPRVVEVGNYGGEVAFGVVLKGKNKEAYIQSMLKDQLKKEILKSHN